MNIVELPQSKRSRNFKLNLEEKWKTYCKLQITAGIWLAIARSNCSLLLEQLHIPAKRYLKS